MKVTWCRNQDVIKCLALALMCPSTAFAEPFVNTNWVPGQLLIQYTQSQTPLKSFKAQKPSLRDGIELLQYSPDVDVVTVAELLRTSADVAWAEPNYRRYARQVAPSAHPPLASSQQYMNHIRLPEAWDLLGQDNSSVRLAVIDDAFDIHHPDFRANVDLNAAYDFISNDNDPSPEQCVNPETGAPSLDEDGQIVYEWHGTAVAGVLGAVTGNDEGIQGGSYNATIVPLRIGCWYTVADEIAAFDRAIQANVDIINISYGGPMFSEFERRAVEQLRDEDILLVTAAGNNEVNNDKVPDYPSGLDFPNILSVAATNHQLGLTKWSQYGPTSVDVGAPGLEISTLAWRRKSDYDNGAVGLIHTVGIEGTSFSAPLVAATAALVKGYRPQASFHDLKGAIMASVTPLTNLSGRLSTDGQVDALAAMQAQAQPVVVIKSINVDDLEFGNGNGLVDRGEVFDLVIELENVWRDAASVTGNLQILQPANVSLASASNAFDAGAIRGRSEETKFIRLTVQADTLTPKMAVPFTLAISADGYQFNRSFTIDIGDLLLNETVSDVLHDPADLQNDFHYYYFDLKTRAEQLVFDLTSDNGLSTRSNLDMLVRYGGPVLFDYSRYDLPNPVLLEGVVAGTRVASTIGLSESLTYHSPSLGRYFVVVLVPKNNDEVNRQYSLTVSASQMPRARVVNTGSVFSSYLPFVFIVTLLILMRCFTRKQKI